jgi:hypothetical protein
MGIFRKRPAPTTTPPPAPPLSDAPAAAAGSGGAKPHWADIEAIRAEWPPSRLDASADLASWQEGVRLYQNDDYPSMMRCAQLVAPALAHSLYGEGILRGADLPETVHKALYSALSPPPDGKTFDDPAQRVCRLALLIIRENGWQPASMGGNGMFDQFVDGSRILLGIALAPDDFSMGGNLPEFFAVPPTAPTVTIARAPGPVETVDRLYDTLQQANAGDEMSEAHIRGMGLWLEGNREEALEVLSEAGRLGSAQAMKDAGDLARELGRDAEARFWFESAANAGHPGALYNMGVYATNAGDLDQAASWWQRSAEAGNPDGYAALTQFADNRGDAAGERRWARLGAEAGHPFCQFRHGLYTLMDNPGDAPAARRAVVYLEAAAELGDLDAMTLVVNVHHQLGQVEQGQAWAARVRATGDQGSIERLDRYGY